MADERVKVVGYAQKRIFDEGVGAGIEYRNFSDNLVGNQIIEDEGTAIFTMGNFRVTTNISPKVNRIFKSKKFSNFVTLNELDLTCDEVTTLLKNNAEVKLKLDKSNLCNYAYFGSTQEYVRVTLENIISTWPASLYMDPNFITTNGSGTGHTMQNYSYDLTYNEATFQINTSTIKNKFDINYLTNGTIIDTFNEGNDLRNLTVNYSDYVVYVDNTEYPIKYYTGAKSITNGLLSITVVGNPFTGTTSFRSYHIKPKSIKVEEFFNGLGDLDDYLLNRMVIPEYTAKFTFPIVTNSGIITQKDRIVQWPVTDGYNIDFDTTKYIDYVTELLNIATNSDEAKSNLIVRFLTSDSISEFDTLPNCDGNEEETAGQKMNKTLKVYGREFDEIKRYTDGIQWANTVTYNQKNNTPDIILKNLARTLGWDIISSVLENDLLKSYVEPKDNTYGGHSRGLTPIEAEYELWRRLVLNSAWLWKSKGTRKAVEFLFKFIGAPNGLINFNEYVYKTNEVINVDQFKAILEQQGADIDMSLYSVDSEGYPMAKPNTPDLYFQKGGLWWRETGGSGSTIDILNGNNPHVGPYDAGQEYMDQFNTLIPNFTAVTITEQTITSGDTNIFINYNSGLINSFTPVADNVNNVYYDVLDDNNQDQSGVVSVTADVINDPCPSVEMTDCGCETGASDHALRFNISKNKETVAFASVGLESCLYRLPESLDWIMNIMCPSDKWVQFDITDIIVNGVSISSGVDSTTVNCGNLNKVDLDGDGNPDSFSNVTDYLNLVFTQYGLSNYSTQLALTKLTNQEGFDIDAPTFYIHRPIGDTFSFKIKCTHDNGSSMTVYYKNDESGTMIPFKEGGDLEEVPNGSFGYFPWDCNVAAPELINGVWTVIDQRSKVS